MRLFGKTIPMLMLAAILLFAISVISSDADAFQQGSYDDTEYGVGYVLNPADMTACASGFDPDTVRPHVTIRPQLTVEGRTYDVTSIGFAAFEECDGILSVRIPDSVTVISDFAFLDCVNLGVVNIPPSVTEIGEAAFSGTSISSITVPGGVKVLYGTFSYCYELREVTLAEGIEELPLTFIHCRSLRSISLPSSVTYVDQAFVNTPLERIDVDDRNVTFMDDDGVLYARNGILCHYPSMREDTEYRVLDGTRVLADRSFMNCIHLRTLILVSSVSGFENVLELALPNLKRLIVESEDGRYVSVNGVLYSSDMTVLIRYPADRKDVRYEVEEGTVAVSEDAFRGNVHLREVVLPDGLVAISSTAFTDCRNLESVHIPGTLRHIGFAAFHTCLSLRSVELPAGLETIGTMAFVQCFSLMEVTVPSGVKVLDSTFNDCYSLRRVTIEGAVEYLSVFNGCDRLEHLTLPYMAKDLRLMGLGSLRTIEFPEGNANYELVDGVLFSKDLRTLVLYPAQREGTSYLVPEGTETIMYTAFNHPANLESIGFPRSLRSIEEDAFSDAGSLRSVSLYPGVEVMDYLFSHCPHITEFQFPEGVESIRYSLEHCDSLETVRLPASLRVIGDSVFEGCPSLRTIEVAAGNVNFKVVDGVLFSKDGRTLLRYPPMSDRSTYTVPDGVEVIFGSAFGDAVRLRDIELPDSLVRINAGAFDGCVSLTSVDIPPGTYVGTSAFGGCLALRAVFVRADVVLGEGAFNGCRNLRSVHMDPSVRDIDYSVFDGCGSIGTIEIFDGNDRFRVVDGVLFSLDGTVLMRHPSASYRHEYAIPDGTEIVLSGAFLGCRDLWAISIPASVRIVEDGAFDGCTGLEHIDVDPKNAFFDVMDGVLFTSDGSSLVSYPAGLPGSRYSIPEGTLYVHAYAFRDVRYLAHLYVPSSVTDISLPPSELTGFESFTVHEGNPYLESRDGVLYQKGLSTLVAFPNGSDMTQYTIPKELVSITAHAFAYCRNLKGFAVEAGNGFYRVGTDGSLYCEDTLVACPLDGPHAPGIGEGTRRLDDHIFAGSGFRTFTIPDWITSLGTHLFAFSSIREVTVGKGITRLPHAMFEGCASLETIRITSDSDTLLLEDGVLRGCGKVRFESGRDGYGLNVYIDRERTLGFDGSDPDFTGMLYLEWRELVTEDDGGADTEPFVLMTIFAVTLLSLWTVVTSNRR